jgi:hypothetical protein
MGAQFNTPPRNSTPPRECARSIGARWRNRKIATESGRHVLLVLRGEHDESARANRGGAPRRRESGAQALIEYEPAKVSPGQLRQIILDLGYTVRDAKKVRTFEEEQAELRGERNNLLIAAAFTAVALTMMVLMWTGIVTNPHCIQRKTRGPHAKT